LPATAGQLSPIERLGKSLFNDPSLSMARNRACVDCHAPGMGFAGPRPGIRSAGGIVEGSLPGSFGNRKPASAAYATLSPLFHRFAGKGEPAFAGGLFWDGRATGEDMNDPAADQAREPFLNPVEMALPHAACAVQRVCEAQLPGRYPVSFQDVWGAEICYVPFSARLGSLCSGSAATIMLDSIDEEGAIASAFRRIAYSISRYLSSAEVNRFASRFDHHLAGNAIMTEIERAGLEIFRGKGKCAECHALSPPAAGGPPVFTDFTYANLGVPRNPANPWYGQTQRNPAGVHYVDPGLGGHLRADSASSSEAASQWGKHKVPTLRNVDKRLRPGIPKRFMHNGYFETLDGIVTFLNTRDVWPRCDDDWLGESQALARRCWPEPEVAENIDHALTGDLKLTRAEEAALVAFMKSLTDED
jgi:cytochrome c peroxidase